MREGQFDGAVSVPAASVHDMKPRIATVTAAAASVFVLAGCGPSASEEAAATAFEACDRPVAEHQLLVHDGDEVRVEVTGETARAMSGMDDVTEALERGDTDVDFSSAAVAMGVLLAVDCLVEDTGYPGSSDQLRDGEEWDGWEYREESGAGSEFVATFTATG